MIPFIFHSGKGKILETKVGVGEGLTIRGTGDYDESSYTLLVGVTTWLH